MNTEFDGLTFDTALIVGSVEEEYEWLRIKFPGFRMIEQSVQYHKNAPHDVVTIELKDSSHITLHFDVSEFFDEESAFLTDWD